MLFMHVVPIIACRNRRMAAFTAGRLQPIIAMFRRRDLIGKRSFMALQAVGWRTVHLVAGVAIHAGHPALAEMHIRFEILMFAHILIANPASVTGSAVIGHGRFCLEDMTVYKTTIH